MLDGVERLLLAYSRADASRLADDDLDVSLTGRPRLLDTVDPRAGVFLRRLAGLRASRVLITSRLVPRDLQRDTAEPVPGVHTCLLGGLTGTDAVALWRQSGVTGSRAELVELFASFGNYPLLIRVLAGEVDRFRPAPGDFAAWRQANPGFDQFSLPLVQRRAQVLEYALGRLTEPESRVLHTVAAFRSPVAFPTLVALLVGDDHPCAGQADLDRVLTALEDRGLLGWDRVRNRYDLHPVVRAVAWSALGPDARHGIDRRLARHLGEIPEVDDTAITSMDDLSSTFELYHTLVRLGRLGDAVEVLSDRIFYPLTRLGGYRDLAELARGIIAEPGWLQQIVGEGDLRDAALVCGIMGIGYQLAGDPLRALDGYDLASPDQLPGDIAAARLILRSMALDQQGRLAEAERCARAALAHRDLDEFLTGHAMTALGSVLLHRGSSADGAGWLADYRTTLGRGPIGELAPDYLPLYELGWAALHRGDLPGAEAFANRLDGRAATSDRNVHVSVCARVLRGVLAGLRVDENQGDADQGDADRAGALLSGAVADAREAGLGELEIVGLTQLAQWHLRGGRLPEARDHARDAAQLAERSGLRLRWADALNLLSRVEHAAGDTETAAHAAHDACRQAWCDGPSFSYQVGLDEARDNLREVGAPEPAGLEGFEPGEPFPEVLIRPDPIRPGADLTQSQVIAAIEAVVDPVAAAELDAILRSSAAAPIRVAALRALARLETDDERRQARAQRAARDQTEEVRAAAVPLLDHQAATVLRSLAEHDPVPMVRLAAVPLLAARDSAEAGTVLSRIARRDGDPEVRVRALTALTRARDGIVGARPTLLDAVVDDPELWVRGHAAELITGLEPRAHDALLRRRAGADPEPCVWERLLMLLAGARGTWLWHWPDLVIDGSAVTRPAATIDLDAGLRSLLVDCASDPSVLVRVAVRLLLAAARPVPPGEVLLGEFLAAPSSDH